MTATEPEAAVVDRTELWGPRSRLGLGAGSAASILLVGVGWWGVSGEATVGSQYRWLSVAVLGAIVGLATGAGWVFAGMRSVGRRIRAVVPVPAEVASGAVDLHLVPGAEHAVSDALVAAAGMRYYHRADCALVRGKPAGRATRSEHVSAGRAACGVCRPDDVAGRVSAA